MLNRYKTVDRRRFALTALRLHESAVGLGRMVAKTIKSSIPIMSLLPKNPKSPFIIFWCDSRNGYASGPFILHYKLCVVFSGHRRYHQSIPTKSYHHPRFTNLNSFRFSSMDFRKISPEPRLVSTWDLFGMRRSPKF